jgi:5-methylcytosine-specific restriction enzyme subunit McrC
MTSVLIELREYEKHRLSQDALAPEEGELLWRDYGKVIQVEPPSFRTGNQWELTPQGYVGFIPLPSGTSLALRPKVPIENLFRMLEYAYDLNLRFLEGQQQVSSLDELYSRLAHHLALKVLGRSKRGLHKAYLEKEEELRVVRGRLDAGRLIRSPSKLRLDCTYEEHTADISDNQLLAWTLHIINRSGLCSGTAALVVRKAYRTLQGAVTLTPLSYRDCLNRLYNRLNSDYEPMHLLCRFFLENTGPQFLAGPKRMLPFLINMNRLYELFVARWLEQHLPAELRVRVQEHVSISTEQGVHFYIDMVLYRQDQALYVMDTKYKDDSRMAASDIHEVVSYAQAKGCASAVLIYPVETSSRITVGGTSVQSLSFVLEGKLERHGQIFLDALLAGCTVV